MAADAVPQWVERDGGLHRVFESADFSEAFALSSHSAGNIVTDADRELAARIDRFVA